MRLNTHVMKNLQKLLEANICRYADIRQSCGIQQVMRDPLSLSEERPNFDKVGVVEH